MKVTVGVVEPKKSKEEERHSKILANVEKALTSMSMCKNLPDCFELVVTMLNYYIALSLTSPPSDDLLFHENQSDYPAILERDLKRLKPLYEKEDQFSSGVI